MSEYTAIIRKGRIFIRRWNSEKVAYEEKEKRNQTLVDALQWPIKIEGTTFGEFFELIAKDFEMYQIIFRGATGGFPIKEFIQECRKKGKRSKDLDYVEVYWSNDLCDGEVTIHPGFHGWGDWKDPHARKDGITKGGIAIEYTPLNEYKDCPLVLNDEFQVWELSKDKDKPTMRGKRAFEVYDVLRAILYEITWSGDIKGREERIKQFRSTAKEAMANLDKSDKIKRKGKK